MKEKSFIIELFKLLADNKKFPSYQAERRIDLFFNFFLEDILKAELGGQIKFVAPEFPLKKLNKEGKFIRDNLSVKLDYLYKREINNTVEALFVELKTDAKSYDPNQHKKYLAYDWAKAIESLKQIIHTKDMPFDDRLKYYHLVKALDSSKLISLPQEFRTLHLLKNKKGEWKKKQLTLGFIDCMKYCEAIDSAVSVYYIGPKEIEDKFEAIELFNGKIISIDQLKKKIITFDDISNLNIDTKYLEIWRLMKESLLIKNP